MSRDTSAAPDARAIARFHPLSDRAITSAVGETSPGNFVLGYFDGSDFVPYYVGRSDADVGASLHEWVGAPSLPRRHETSPYEPWRSRSAPLPGLGTRALGRIAVGIDTPYTHFACRYAATALAAFERECRDYHELGEGDGLDNPGHPQPPPGSPWTCPVHGSVA